MRFNMLLKILKRTEKSQKHENLQLFFLNQLLNFFFLLK